MPIVNPTLPNQGESADAPDISVPFTQLLAVFNGAIGTDNIATGALTTANFADNSITTAKINATSWTPIWTNITPKTNYGTGGFGGVSTLQITKDPTGTVFIRGLIAPTSGTWATRNSTDGGYLPFNIPTGYLPGSTTALGHYICAGIVLGTVNQPVFLRMTGSDSGAVVQFYFVGTAPTGTESVVLSASWKAVG